MTPVLVTPPASPVVDLPILRDHCRVDGTHDDGLLMAYEAAAVAYLDGWTGVLGRAIRAQTWRITGDGEGPHLLPMTDVVSVSATADGDAVEVVQRATARGVEVTVPRVSGEVVIDFTVEMPDRLRPAVEVAIMLMVSHWYENREAVSETAMQSVPMAVDALIGAIRWRSV